jgi:1-acyl-sn-glycerol-3-phosphate acyltransferase
VPSATEPAAAGAPGAERLDGRPVQIHGSRAARALLRLLGWELLCDGLPGRQGVIAVYPHTSNWDFPVGLLFKWAVGLPATFWGKHTLFRVPLLGRWLRYVGGVPVDRRAPQGLVGEAVAAMHAARDEDRPMWVVVAPEGTRSATPGWRSGFYAVAHGAGVPVGLAVLDFGRKRVGFDSFWRTSGDAEADLATFAQQLAAVRGCRPERAGPVRLVKPR